MIITLTNLNDGNSIVVKDSDMLNKVLADMFPKEMQQATYTTTKIGLSVYAFADMLMELAYERGDVFKKNERKNSK